MITGNMRELPILFSTSMVQSIITGQKTQTRREIKLSDVQCLFDDLHVHTVLEALGGNPDYNESQAFEVTSRSYWIADINCPYSPGDIIYVREKWAARDCSTSDGTVFIEFAASEGNKYRFNPKKSVEIVMAPLGEKKKWKPSIHLPKELSRIWLKIISVRADVLHNISPNDAYLEGIETWNEDYHTEPGAVHADHKNYNWKDNPNHKEYNFPSFANPVASFSSLWQSIYGEESWTENPWVWVIEFEVLSLTGRPEAIDGMKVSTAQAISAGYDLINSGNLKEKMHGVSHGEEAGDE